MDNAKLVEQINEWHNVNEHQKIIDAILSISEEQRDYFINGQLAVAYNNIRNYDEATRILFTIEEEGKTDYKWYYRLGYTCYFNSNYSSTKEKKFEVAKSYFESANELSSGTDKDVIDFIDKCNNKLDYLKKVKRSTYKSEELLLILKNGELEETLKQYKIKIDEQSLGILNLPTGKIVANDPIAFFEYTPFATTVDAGKYPVFIHLMGSYPADNTGTRVAFAEIRFLENLPTRFEIAILSGSDKESRLGNDYGVDHGTGAYMDYETCLIVKDKIDQSNGMDMIDELSTIENALEQNDGNNNYSTANEFLPNTENNIVAFSSGAGDGGYFSYWGFDEQNLICCLITDFGLIVDN